MGLLFRYFNGFPRELEQKKSTESHTSGDNSHSPGRDEGACRIASGGYRHVLLLLRKAGCPGGMPNDNMRDFFMPAGQVRSPHVQEGLTAGGFQTAGKRVGKPASDMVGDPGCIGRFPISKPFAEGDQVDDAETLGL